MTPDDAPQDDGRRILHIDMDAFYASVEQRDDPALRGRPVAVGGSSARGVVAAASYEARRFGVRSAMPSVTAKRRCPELIFVRPRFDVYRAVSRQIREIFARHTPLIEPLSLDEAYLDLTGRLGPGQTASAQATAIRDAIRDETGLTASAGISYCKFLAKLASDQRKPDGQFTIPPAHGARFIAELPIDRFHGIGPATAARMRALGIETGADLRGIELSVLQRRFGKAGQWYHDISRGIDNRPVRPNRVRKSIGTETTFSQNLTTLAELLQALRPLAEKVWAQAGAARAQGRCVTIKLRFGDFRQITRSRSLPQPVPDGETLFSLGAGLVEAVPLDARGVRLLGITLSGLHHGENLSQPQLDLFQTDHR
ncbi:DNA polymerase IV [Paracoccus jeotgali]|uniref:DNA polymerase IV n=1 Tax=Paracoccus jeotgali TaxID=2065379 RepID=UPI0028B25B50|nr:DNA polymerase IV [Paracoccus jeotgali]